MSEQSDTSTATQSAFDGGGHRSCVIFSRCATAPPQLTRLYRIEVQLQAVSDCILAVSYTHLTLPTIYSV